MRLKAFVCLILAAAGSQAGTTESQVLKVREPAVVGMFYPAEQARLRAMIDGFLAKATPPMADAADVGGLICPHAGYEYSGSTAAFSYKLLEGRSGLTVIVLAPSHYADFRGAAVSGAEQRRSPLGLIQISPKAKELARKPPFIPEAPARVASPSWARLSRAEKPDRGTETPFTYEHSLEVQVPFLQRVLPDCSLIPVVCGDVDPAEAAKTLSPFVDDKTVVIASSDLSHYHPYGEARQLDGSCVSAVTRMDFGKMETQEACGKAPILILMHLAREKGWTPKLLDYRNSGDTAGDKSRVVGYAAIAFYRKTADKVSREDNAGRPASDELGGGEAMEETSSTKPGGTEPAGTLTHEDAKALLQLARRSLDNVVRTGKLPDVDESKLPAKLKEIKGCFVTLTEGGMLRGCIGHIFPREPLYQSVLENARSAALHDTRFAPVRPEELDRIEVEVSVLTVPELLEFASAEELLAKLRPHKDGVVLQIGSNMATYLPQVWEQLPEKESFLGHLAQKAGCEAEAWRKPGTIVKIYHVEAFKESEFRAK